MLALKGNQPRLYDTVENAFAAAGLEPEVTCRERGHGREELRQITALDINPHDPACAAFPNVQQIFRIERQRVDHRTGHTTHETVYAITNATRQRMPPALAAQTIRNHWHIENILHRQKDVRMQEDHDRTHTRHAPQNLGALRNFALNILNQATAKAAPARRWEVIKRQPWRLMKTMGIAD